MITHFNLNLLDCFSLKRCLQFFSRFILSYINMDFGTLDWNVFFMNLRLPCEIFQLCICYFRFKNVLIWVFCDIYLRFYSCIFRFGLFSSILSCLFLENSCPIFSDWIIKWVEIRFTKSPLLKVDSIILKILDLDSLYKFCQIDISWSFLAIDL